MERKHTPIYGIKGKLVSAVAMLLVAIVMVVSSTYAWFTLSTAPEVSGIQTSIGANGALEIWLNTSDTADSNYTHGNIVQLNQDKYGLQNIVLLPSKLQLDDADTINIRYLSIPQYGANGAPLAELSNNRTEAGIFNGTSFIANGTNTGVRAVGVASGLTERQNAYRGAKYAAATASGQATTTVATSLNTYGGTLGAIVVKKAAEASPEYTYAEVSALTNIIADLEAAIGYIDTAYKQMIIAFAASKQVTEDAVYSTVAANFADNTLKLDTIADTGKITVTVSETDHSVDIAGTSLHTALTELKTTRSEIAAAKTALATLFEGATDSSKYTWAQIREVVDYLINANKATLNGAPDNGGLSLENATKDDIANSVINKGVNIWLNDDSGVYTDIADHCGNYNANVTMENVKVSGATFESLTANMKTNSTQNPSHLNGTKAQVERAGEPEGTGTVMPMTEFYGFILDLGFQTNAANSNLLLQTEAVDRIYEDNNNELTQGGGSYMTFAATTTELTNAQVKGLMDCIRIVFFDTATRDILGEARLDIANATTGADGVTAKMYMYKDGALQNGANADASITALTQNTAKNISVFVYLDGEELGNDDVAATSAKSVTGKMNIQFASDAELVPMEYGDLHTPNQTTTTTTTTANH